MDDTAGIITGALVALVAGVVIPFLTSQFSLWTDRRTALVTDRREALSALIRAETNVTLRVAAAADEIIARGRGGSARRNYTDVAEIQARRVILTTMFTTSDAAVREVFLTTRPADPYEPGYLTEHATLVLATWAAGRDIRARRAAKRLLVKLKQEQSQPERDARDQTNSQTDEQTG